MTQKRKDVIYYAFLIYFFLFSIFILYLNRDNSPFLGDQINQIQLAETIWKGRIKSLYGPYLSTTYPVVYTFGPLTAIIISILNLATPSKDFLHVGFALINIFCGLYLIQSIRKISLYASLITTGILLCLQHYWFALSLFWSNVLIFGVVCLFTSKYISFLKRSNNVNLLWVYIFYILGLHLHLIGVVLTPIVIYATFLFIKKPVYLKISRSSVLIFCFSIIPYILAELIRKFANTKAIFFNLIERSNFVNNEASNKLILIFFNPFFSPENSFFTLISFVFIFFIFISTLVYFINKRNWIKKLEIRFIFSILFLLLFQWLFFYKLGQPYRSQHYGMYLSVFSVILFSFFIYKLTSKNKFLIKLFVLIFLYSGSLFLLFTSSENKTKWSYRQTVESLNRICRNYPVVKTFELDSFRTPESDFYTVLEYLIKKDLTMCKYSDESKFIIVPELNGNLESTFQPLFLKDKYKLLTIEPPGIGIYTQLPASQRLGNSK